MELYLHATDPFRILRNELPVCAPTWSGDPQALEGIEYPFVDKNLFSCFYARYRAIVISSGLPRNDYGQTVRLYMPRQFTEPDVATIAQRLEVPKHLVSENLPFKPSAMIGWCRYQKEEGDASRGGFPVPRVIEQFFFAYQPSYQPSSFADLSGSLSALRYLSTIMHELNQFKVILLESGIYVRLAACVVEGAKPPFIMGS